MIFVIDDDEIMRGCIVRACGEGVKVREFADGIAAMAAISEGAVPELVFLDILLDGPDGFTFLNEMVSYADTVQVPVVIVSSLDFEAQDLAVYGVVGVLKKEKMRPQEIMAYVQKHAS